MATPASGVDVWLTLNDVPLRFEADTDNLDAKATEWGRNLFEVTSKAPKNLEILVEGAQLDTAVYGRWLWKPAAYAGLYEIEVRARGYPSYTTHVRVIPSHFSYACYEQMLADISAISADLLFQLESPAAERLQMQTPRQGSAPLREYDLIAGILDSLAQAVAQIRHNPYRKLVEHAESRLLHQVNHFSGQAMPNFGPTVPLPVEVATRMETAILPTWWQVSEPSLTFDTYENRLLKHFLWRQLWPRLNSIKERAQKEIQRREVDRKTKLFYKWIDDANQETEQIKALQAVVADCDNIGRRVISWGSADFLRQVGDLGFSHQPTQVLQKHPAYSRFFHIYLLFQRELWLTLDPNRYVTTLALRKMWELYQIWSVFQMTHVLMGSLRKAGYQLKSSRGFFSVRDDEFHIDVERGAAIELVREATQIIIRYEPLYPAEHSVPEGLVAASRVQRTPDMALEIRHSGGTPKVIIFDAKYKSAEQRGITTYEQEDLDKMSRYTRDIRWKQRVARSSLRYAVSSAYILYPGDVLEHDVISPEVGALPFVPGKTPNPAFMQALKEILEKVAVL